MVVNAYLAFIKALQRMYLNHKFNEDVKAESQSLRYNFAQVAKDLHYRSHELQFLRESVPGGVHQCKNDPLLTIVNISSGFLTLFGYTRKELTTIFGDNFMNMKNKCEILLEAAQCNALTQLYSKSATKIKVKG